MTFKEIFTEAKVKKEKAPTAFIVELSRGSNKTYLPIRTDGTPGSMRNQSDVLLSLTNISFNLSPGDFKAAGYKNSGTSDQNAYIKDSIKRNFEKSKGDASKFAKLFSADMKLNFTVQK